MTISVLIIDDEPLAREGIRIRLKDYPEINVIGECKNGAEAIDSIRRLSPDLVFLDIKMPKTTGFDVVKTIGCENMPAIIFLTAYDEFAIEAFRVHAIDYLLKPINEKQLRDSLNNAFNIIQNKQLSTKTSQLTQLLNTLEQSTLKKSALEKNTAKSHQHLPTEQNSTDKNQRIIIRNNGHVYLLKEQDIHWIEADGDYVTLHTKSKSHLVRDTMKNMAAKLLKHGFQRVHRSSIVNINHIRELIALDSGDYQIVLFDNTTIKLSRHYRDTLYARLNAT